MIYLHEREELVKTGKDMLASALTVGTWGNISLRISNENLYAITPSGMDYKNLTPADIVIVDLKGNIIDGDKKPSVENPMHRIIYKARNDVEAVLHTHSIYASALAAARKPIPAAIEDLIQIVGGDVKVADYFLPGTDEVGKSAVKSLKNRNGVLLANHGVIGVGRDLKEAVTVCQIIEKAARITIAAQAVGGVVPLGEEDINVMREYYLNSYGQ